MKIDHIDIDGWVEGSPRQLQWFARALTRGPGRWLFQYRAFSSERVPRSGGFIIAPNHGSKLDGFFFGHGFDRSVRFMAKYQALEWPLLGRMVKWAGGFPVRRGVDSGVALEIARRVLAGGHGLIMFMEGHLVRTPGLGEPRSGLAILALQTGVPVVPVAAWGNKPAAVYGRRRRFWHRPRTTVVWGEPMRFPQAPEPGDDLIRAVREEIWAEVARLHEIARELHELPTGRPAKFDIPPRVGGGLAEQVSGPFASTHTQVTAINFTGGSVALAEPVIPPLQAHDDLRPGADLLDGAGKDDDG